MAKTRKAAVVDGYSVIKAAQHAAETGAGDAERPGVPPDHVGRTTVPTKRFIICYECGYTFQLHGRVDHTFCSKCRVKLDCVDHLIESKHTASIKTTGTVRISRQGRLANAQVIGQDIILQGALEDGASLRALRQLEIGPGAVFSQANIVATDLKVAAGANARFAKRTQYRNLELAGTLEAEVCATGVVTIHAGGLMRGRLETAHLIVEEGGGLMAEVKADIEIRNPKHET